MDIFVISSVNDFGKRNKQMNLELPAHPASIVIYSSVARFPCDNTTFVLTKIQIYRNPNTYH